MKIRIDPYAGFCSGVIRAIRMAEKELDEHGHLYCLGDIVHNEAEVQRLLSKGLEVIDLERFKQLNEERVLIRAHGEPPSTFEIAAENNLYLVDASCKVVIRLQDKIEKVYNEIKDSGGQVLIFGKAKHPEVIGLNGHTNNNAIVIETIDDLEKVNFDKPIRLFSQTTKSVKGFRDLLKEITSRLKEGADFRFEETICKQVSGRELSIAQFAESNDVNVFVGGEKSSNAKYLFGICEKSNPRSYFITDKSELEPAWFDGAQMIGITGATSTPRWQMEEVKNRLEQALCI